MDFVRTCCRTGLPVPGISGARIADMEDSMQTGNAARFGSSRAVAPRFVVVVPPERPDVYEQLQEAMSGEDVRVIVDRRHEDRRRQTAVPHVDRRRTYRRGTATLSMTPSAGAA
jgi:hypothetical protein